MSSRHSLRKWSDIKQQLANLKSVEGGFTPAKRGLLSLPDGKEVFVKLGLHDHTKKWAKKEIAVYRFLEKHSYPYSPRLLAASGDESAFAIEAYVTADGWNWRDDWSQPRLDATLHAMDELAAIKLSDEEKMMFSEKSISQDDDGWQLLLVSKEKQELLLEKLHGIGADDIASGLDFPAEAKRSAKYELKDNTLVHYDMRADNCAWNERLGQIKIVDWNWTQLGDKDIELAATLTHVQKSGFDLPDDIVRKFNPEALHWMAGFWLNAASTPIWEGGPGELRDFQLLAGITALKLEQRHAKLV